MFSEDDLPADPILVGADNEPIILDRLQVQKGFVKGTVSLDINYVV